jgi:hypothetical protein
MQDLDSDTVVAAFLLETLGVEDRERVLTRLEEDEDYFERVAAFESDLILQWHRGDMPAGERELFARAYATPARRRLVEQMDVVIRVAEMATSPEAAPAPHPAVVTPAKERARAPEGGRGVAAWLSASWTVPRWFPAAAAVAIAAAFISGAYVGSRRSSVDPSGVPPGSTIFGMRLTAVGEKGPAIPKGFDTLDLPLTASMVQLTVQPTVTPEAPLTAVLTSPDRAIVLQAGTPMIGHSSTGTTLTVTVRAADLPDGDYILIVRGTDANAGGTGVISTQAFRVTRQQRPAR